MCIPSEFLPTLLWDDSLSFPHSHVLMHQATVTKYVELNDKKIAQGTYDLCAATGACQFAPHTGRAFDISQTIPAFADDGKYVSRVQVHDQVSTTCSCVNLCTHSC